MGKLKILAVVVLVVAAQSVFGMDSMVVRNHKPSALLIMLKSEQSRINAVTGSLEKEKKAPRPSAKRIEMLEGMLANLKQDAATIRNDVMNDYYENFHICPVYYFIDTNLDRVIEGKFQDIIFTGHTGVAVPTADKPDFRNYFIAYYGMPVEQHGRRPVKDSSIYITEVGRNHGVGMVLNNNKLQQVAFIHKPTVAKLFSSLRKSKNAYTSKTFDMSYFPSAGMMQKFFERRVSSNSGLHR
jgi:hypothetical protein